ncbi:30S ribosomal protein S10, chloroplastic isoform X1 [Brassica napus]|uniref:30S ribosomal protein S10, chloroplastic isoform X1 n=1 Tax=Brassica napus TaxID=3708 RepID=UPI0004F1BCEB|nr:30S ribosomal protein S10, chloroplastic isoform X1 [Brassica napus]
MAVSSVTSFILPPSFSNPTSSSSTRQKLSLLSLLPTHGVTGSSLINKPSVSFTKRIFAAPETLSPETLDEPVSEVPSSSSISVDADKQMAPKQKIRIKLRSYWVPLIEDSCKQILDAARNTNAKTMGPVPLPTKKRIYCVLKSPHVHKDARFHFEIRTHQRMIDILYPTAQTIDSLMQLDLPAGVDVEVKL